jgi:hypothetical protein
MFVEQAEQRGWLYQEEVFRPTPRIALGGDFERYLDDYIAGMGTHQRETVERDYTEFRSYYFDHNEDRARKAAFLEVLGGLSPSREERAPP